MDGNGVPKEIRRRLYLFGSNVARPFSDSRRQRFIQEMIAGLVVGGHVHLSKVARAVSSGTTDIHGVEKRLSLHLGSEHWDMSPLADDLLKRSAAMVNDDTLIVADLTDMAKPHARVLEGLGRVHDGSDPEGCIVKGYAVFEAYVRVGKWQLFPLLIEPMKAYSGAPTSENAEIIAHVLRIHQATEGRATWILDRGFDRDELMLPWLRHGLSFVIRERGDRHVDLEDGRRMAVTQEKKRGREPIVFGTTFALNNL